MSVRHFCTYFDHNYLPRGMVMLESLHEHSPRAHIHVLCLSDLCYAALSALAYPYVSPIRLADLEATDPELVATRVTRSLIEYYFTLTPCLPWYLFKRDRTMEEVTYLDADMLFFSSPEPIFEEAQGASVIITPHRFAANLQDRVYYGLYNVSWLTFRRTKEGLACLNWYRTACLDWCKDEVEEDRFADQKYLDAFPRRFAGVHVMHHSGGGVAPWNLADTTIDRDKENFSINGSPLIFYHAHGFKRLWGPLFASGLAYYSVSIFSPALLFLFKIYAKKIMSAEKILKKRVKTNIHEEIRYNSNYVLWELVEKIVFEYKKHTLLICFSI